MNYYKESISEKDIWIVEKHNEVLYPWSVCRRNTDMPLDLITMDYHTDTHEAFCSAAYGNDHGNNYKKRQKEFIDKFDFYSDEKIKWAIENIKNDEQIKTAMATGILGSVFVIAYNHDSGNIPASDEERESMSFFQEHQIEIMLGEMEDVTYNPPYHYSEIKEPLYIPSWEIYTGKDKDDLRSLVIDDCFLLEMFHAFHEMSPEEISDIGSFRNKYILDIDLDFFYDEKSLNPKFVECFYKLIQNAEIITIATEPVFVEMCCSIGMNVEYSLERIKQHIQKALG